VTAPAQLESWSGTDVTVSEIERALARLRSLDAQDDVPDMRTSVMTHLAWVPPEWLEAATRTLAGMGERHPSRTILLVADREAGSDGIDAEVAVHCFSMPGMEQLVSTEVIRLHLRGERTRAPASIIMPLLLSDLPVFMRWRGKPPFGASELRQLLTVVDRLVVDSTEWLDLPQAYRELEGIFERVAASDIAFGRSLGWRGRLAERWPAISEIRRLRVAAPLADALLLVGWLRSRLERDIELVHEEAAEIELVAVDDDAVPAPRELASPSDLLSAELDRFGRDRVYEAAVRAAR
jgi:glucose-6-phosphate dehydrogenase assembly protein OpcA